MLCCWALESVLSCPVPYRAHTQLDLVVPAIVLWPTAMKCNSNCGLYSPKKVIPYWVSQPLFSAAEGLYPPDLLDHGTCFTFWITCPVTSVVRSIPWSWACLCVASRCVMCPLSYGQLALNSQSRSTAAISVQVAWSACSLFPCSSVTWLWGVWVSI